MSAASTGERVGYQAFPLEVVPKSREHWRGEFYGTGGDYELVIAMVPPLPGDVAADVEHVDGAFSRPHNSTVLGENITSVQVHVSRAGDSAARLVRNPVTGVVEPGTIIRKLVRFTDLPPRDLLDGAVSRAEAIEGWQAAVVSRCDTAAQVAADAYQDAANRFVDPEAATRHANLTGQAVVALTAVTA